MADASFQKEFLKTHNNYRKTHSAPALTLSKDLNVSAQKWADHLLKINRLEHSKMGNGENLYFMSGTEKITLSGKEAVDAWYNEVGNYDWSNPGFSSKTGHFTQVVWKETTELGVGVATNGNTVYVVAEYRPQGNMMGEFPKNVFPAS